MSLGKSSCSMVEPGTPHSFHRPTIGKRTSSKPTKTNQGAMRSARSTAVISSKSFKKSWRWPNTIWPKHHMAQTPHGPNTTWRNTILLLILLLLLLLLLLFIVYNVVKPIIKTIPYHPQYDHKWVVYNPSW